MTKKQQKLVHNLRLALFRSGYPKVFVVNLETLEAAECDILEWMEKNNDPEYPILRVGKNGLFFKGCELVLKA